MASFAKLNNNNIVIIVVSVVNDVLKDSNGIEQESIGIDFLRKLYNEPDAIWKQTSYNTLGNVHLLGGTPFRKNHAATGYTYDFQKDAFISPKPFNSWILDETTCSWNAPISKPVTYTMGITDLNGNSIKDPYIWNEETLNWEISN